VKDIPEPGTSGGMTLDTKTSRGWASDMIRAATCTAIPWTSSPVFSISPVCSPARTDSPMSCTAALTADAHSIAGRTVEGGQHPVAGEQHRRQHPVRRSRTTRPRQEGLDFVEHTVGVTGEPHTVVAVELDPTGIRYALGDPLGVSSADMRIIAA
jgi:hypothetical protein